MITKEELQRLYVDERKSLVTIGKIYNCSSCTVNSLMKRYGIKTRTLKQALNGNINLIKRDNCVIPTKEELQERYVNDKLSTIETGKMYGLSGAGIRYYLLKYGIKIRNSSEASHKIRPWSKGTQPRLGKRHSEETKDKLRLAHLGSRHSQETKDKMKAYRNTPEYKALQSKSQSKIKEMWANPEYRAKQTPVLSRINKFHWENPEYRNKISNSLIQTFRNPISKEKLSKRNKKCWENPEYRQKHIDCAKSNWQKDSYRDIVVKKAMVANQLKPNKPEVFIQSLLDKMYPNNYKYTGDGGVVIGGKCPDFYDEINKRVVLFHGIYWHLLKYQKTNPNLTKEQVEEKDSNHYSKYGYDILIIWEDEMADTNAMLAKIMSFHNKVVIGEKPIAIFEAEIASGVLPKIGGD